MLTLLKIFIGRIKEVESNCFDFIVIFMLLLMLLPTQAEAASFPKGSPEDVVDELMKFDFNIGDRESADMYFEWSLLTGTNGVGFDIWIYVRGEVTFVALFL